MGRKQHAGVKERDREMMESLGARDMGWGTRGLVGGVVSRVDISCLVLVGTARARGLTLLGLVRVCVQTAPLPEVSNPSGGEKSSSTATSLVGPGSMNEERRKRLGRDKVGDLVGVLGGLSTK